MRTSLSRPCRLAMAGIAPLVLLLGCSSSSEDAAPQSGSTSTTTSDPSDGDTASSSTSSSTPSESSVAPAADTQVEVTIEGDRVSPNGAEVDLELGEAMSFLIDSDRAGELHIHAKPEEYLEFGVGTSRLDLSIDTPGVVEVEDHETGNVVAVIEVR